MNREEIDNLIIEEGDYYEWRDCTDSMTCYIERNSMGSWCGYVIIPNTFPITLKLGGYISCHGGVTYESLKDNGDLVIGFDCAHLGDYVPKLKEVYTNYLNKQIYRTKQYVIDQVNLMAEQVLELKEVKRHLKIKYILSNDNQDK